MSLEEYRNKWPDALLTDTLLCQDRSDRAKAKHQDPEFRERWLRTNQDMLSKRWSNPEFRERQRLAAAASWDDPEYRERMIILLEERWNDLEFREAVLEGIRQKWEDPSYRELQRKIASERWNDPAYRQDVVKGLKRCWEDPEYRAQMIASRQATSRTPFERERRRTHAKKLWRDSSYREKHIPFWGKWTREEKIVRGWLRGMGLYLSGSRTEERAGFIGHGWAPTKGAGFSFNADFIDYTFRRIIHVDGWHHTQEETLERDRRNDGWCDQHGWTYLRLPIVDIHKRPDWCKQRIRTLVTEGHSSET